MTTHCPIDRVLLGFMVSEAQSMLDTAKGYRAEMDALPEGDTRRPVYESAILFMLSRSSAMARQVQLCAVY